MFLKCFAFVRSWESKPRSRLLRAMAGLQNASLQPREMRLRGVQVSAVEWVSVHFWTHHTHHTPRRREAPTRCNWWDHAISHCVCITYLYLNDRWEDRYPPHVALDLLVSGGKDNVASSVSAIWLILVLGYKSALDLCPNRYSVTYLNSVIFFYLSRYPTDAKSKKNSTASAHEHPMGSWTAHAVLFLLDFASVG